MKPLNLPPSESNPIRLWRQKKGLSRLQLARLLGISYALLSDIECGYPARLPDRFVQALLSLEFPDEEVGSLLSAYVRWRHGKGDVR